MLGIVVFAALQNEGFAPIFGVFVSFLAQSYGFDLSGRASTFVENFASAVWAADALAHHFFADFFAAGKTSVFDHVYSSCASRDLISGASAMSCAARSSIETFLPTLYARAVNLLEHFSQFQMPNETRVTFCFPQYGHTWSVFCCCSILESLYFVVRPYLVPNRLTEPRPCFKDAMNGVGQGGV